MLLTVTIQPWSSTPIFSNDTPREREQMPSVILIFDIKITSQLKTINIFLGPHISFHFISPLCFLGCRTQFWWHQKKKKMIAINRMWSKLKTGGIYITAKSGENLVGRKDVLNTVICTEIKSNQVPFVLPWTALNLKMKQKTNQLFCLSNICEVLLVAENKFSFSPVSTDTFLNPLWVNNPPPSQALNLVSDMKTKIETLSYWEFENETEPSGLNSWWCQFKSIYTMTV